MLTDFPLERTEEGPESPCPSYLRHNLQSLPATYRYINACSGLGRPPPDASKASGATGEVYILVTD